MWTEMSTHQSQKVEGGKWVLLLDPIFLREPAGHAAKNAPKSGKKWENIKYHDEKFS